MARTISETLKTAQEGTAKVPYIRIYINSVDYSSRLLFLEHIEEPYRDRALLILRNNDRAFDAVDLTGRSFQIGYGYTTGEGDEYCGDGNNDGTPTLWVKNQQIVSSEGQVVCQLYCEGMWMYLREQRVMAYGSAPYYDYQFTATTVYDLIEAIIETAMSWTLNAFAGAQDGIINTFTPVFDLNEMPYESAALVLYRLISMTKCYLRQKADTTWELVYPQTSDSMDKTYYSDKAHYFYEYMEKINEVVPNRIVVYCNQDADGGWTGVITGDTGAYSGNYVEVLEPYVVGSITSQGDANNRAAAILTRIKAEGLAGRLVAPHDCSVELYDKVEVRDRRGA